MNSDDSILFYATAVKSAQTTATKLKLLRKMQLLVESAVVELSIQLRQEKKK